MVIFAQLGYMWNTHFNVIKFIDSSSSRHEIQAIHEVKSIIPILSNTAYPRDTANQLSNIINPVGSLSFHASTAGEIKSLRKLPSFFFAPQLPPTDCSLHLELYADFSLHLELNTDFSLHLELYADFSLHLELYTDFSLHLELYADFSLHLELYADFSLHLELYTDFSLHLELYADQCKHLELYTDFSLHLELYADQCKHL
ncbi:hypothetical protein LOTGIDRAFT_154914 [Lottia gigantea]|uniref:Uncharacterized protein n=1 Tax=Lottia gigantea TaxID=225164 RepID=V3ZM93_LOTGI|nr:hypothetical protein LOTGIDRAFT_154914 [Lottia gigantea]ESO85417.1 hypothetical protein LOTGIDRAFT_154914 [Lottia gigantea]